MSRRFIHKVVEVKAGIFARKPTQHIQAEMDRMAAQGWELVAVTHTHAVDVVRLYFKKEQ